MYFHAYQGSVPASSNILISLANLQRYPDSLIKNITVDVISNVNNNPFAQANAYQDHL